LAVHDQVLLLEGRATEEAAPGDVVGAANGALDDASADGVGGNGMKRFRVPVPLGTMLGLIPESPYLGPLSRDVGPVAAASPAGYAECRTFGPDRASAPSLAFEYQPARV
jgi:hypothetical protein